MASWAVTSSVSGMGSVFRWVAVLDGSMEAITCRSE